MPSLGRIIHETLARDPSRVASRFVSPSGTREVSAAELSAMARRASFLIARRDLPPRSLVGIAMYSGAPLHAAWLGCLWSGHIPTMVAPPSPRMEPGKYADGFAHIVQHLGLKALLADEAAAQALGAGVPQGLALVPIGDLADGETYETIADPPPSEVAVVQHSSGTTGAQKAVALTSDKILRHHDAYAARIALSPQDRIVSWLPLYHDMGFVACLLLPLIAGIAVTEMSPIAWANRPAMLLEAIHRHRPTLCWMPNFAFRLLSDPRVLRGVAPQTDLSSIRLWTNCSEPVMGASLDRFVAALNPFGVTEGSIAACYAMAENVFAVSQSLPGGMRREGEAVSNGPPLETTEVRVRDGELLLRGAHCFGGYGLEPFAPADADGWFATGDLGFVKDGEIYVTGRKKDLIIVRGRNYHAHDIEEAIGALPGVQAGRVCAFGLPDAVTGTEKLIIVAEPESQAREGTLALDIRRQVAQVFDTTASDVRIVPQRWLIKSTSGKMARADNRRKYLDAFG